MWQPIAAKVMVAQKVLAQMPAPEAKFTDSVTLKLNQSRGRFPLSYCPSLFGMRSYLRCMHSIFHLCLVVLVLFVHPTPSPLSLFSMTLLISPYHHG
jgi:hypothetical protein